MGLERAESLRRFDLFDGRGAFHTAAKTHRKGGLGLVKGLGGESLERVEKTLSA